MSRKFTKDDAVTTIFVIDIDDNIKEEFKVWADGRTEGFHGNNKIGTEGGDCVIINNRISPYIDYLKGQIICLKDKVEQLELLTTKSS